MQEPHNGVDGSRFVAQSYPLPIRHPIPFISNVVSSEDPYVCGQH